MFEAIKDLIRKANDYLLNAFLPPALGRLQPGAAPKNSIIPEEMDPHRAYAEDHGAGSSDEEGKDEDDRESSGEGGSTGGGVHFEEAVERDFDATELQDLSIPAMRSALKKGLKLTSRLTKKTDDYLRNLLPDISLRSQVLEVALSDNGHPTLLLNKGEIVQYQFEKGKLERVRVTPDLEAKRAVKYAMAGFLAAGESIDPKHVKFGRSPEFESRMKPIWEQEWKGMLQQHNEMRLEVGPGKDVKFGQYDKPQARTKSVWSLGRTAAPQQPVKPRIDIPRTSHPRKDEPNF